MSRCLLCLGPQPSSAVRCWAYDECSTAYPENRSVRGRLKCDRSRKSEMLSCSRVSVFRWFVALFVSFARTTPYPIATCNRLYQSINQSINLSLSLSLSACCAHAQ